MSLLACPACSSPAHNYASGADSRAYFLCPACGLAFLDPRQRLSPEAEKERYLLHDNGPSNAGYAAYLSSFIDSFLSPFVAPGARILDYGSGPYPLLSRLLSERGYRATAWDPYFAAAPLGTNARFDAAVAHEVLEHCPRPLESLADIARRLVPGGILSLSTLYRPADAQAFLSWWYREDATHVSFFSRECLSLLCSRAGFSRVMDDGKGRAVFRLSSSR
jgi:SAM-dependent methyltransferase